MTKTIRYVGCDVHAETIVVAVAEAAGEVRLVGTIPNTPQAVRQLVQKLGPRTGLRVCYEAGPTGYELHRQLTTLGVACEVIAPTLVPVKAGDRVKTDRRDAVKLARSFRSGDLTPVWVPDTAHEALRDLVRAREAAKRDQLRARQRLGKFLLRHGRRRPAGMKAWTQRHREWVRTGVHFEAPAQQAVLADYLHEVDHAGTRLTRLEEALRDVGRATTPAVRSVIAALQALRGVAHLTAITLVAELGDLTRFAHPRHLMGYAGIVAREHSSGARVRRGAITKTGNAHVRRIVVEAAWAYRHRPAIGPTLRQRQQGLPPPILELAWKAQHRLHRRYYRLLARGKTPQQAITAVGRELLGFIWAIAHARAEPDTRATPRRAA